MYILHIYYVPWKFNSSPLEVWMGLEDDPTPHPLGPKGHWLQGLLLAVQLREWKKTFHQPGFQNHEGRALKTVHLAHLAFCFCRWIIICHVSRDGLLVFHSVAWFCRALDIQLLTISEGYSTWSTVCFLCMYVCRNVGIGIHGDIYWRGKYGLHMDKKQHNNSPTCFETIWSGFLAPRSSFYRFLFTVFCFGTCRHK